jgi:hypothetical protein
VQQHRLRRRGDPQIDRRIGGRVAHRVLEQVHQHLLDQEPVHRHRRQVVGQIDLHAAPAQEVVEAVQRAADHLLDRHPVELEMHRPGLELGDVEEVAHVPVEAHRGGVDVVQQLAPRGFVEVLLVEQRARRTEDRGDRRAQVVAHRAEQRVAQALVLDLEARRGRGLGEQRALERQRGLIGEGLQVVVVRVRRELTAALRQDAEHADDALHGLQRQVARGVGSVRFGAAPGGTAAPQHPQRHGEVGGIERHAAVLRHVAQAAGAVVDEDRGAASEHVVHVAADDARDAADLADARQLGDQVVQRRGPRLALARRLHLLAQGRRQRADGGRDHQHDREVHEVLGVGRDDPRSGRQQREARERADRQHGGEDGGPRARLDRDRDHAQQEHRVEVHGVEPQQRREERTRRDDAGGEHVAPPRDAQLRLELGAARGRRPRVHDVHVHVLAAADQLVHQRSAQAAPPRPVWLADDDAADVVDAREVQQRLADLRAGEGHRARAVALRGQEVVGDVRARRRGEPRRLDVHGEPHALQPLREAHRGAHEARRQRARSDAHHEALAGRPHGRHALLLAVALHLRRHALGEAPQGQLAQRDQHPVGVAARLRVGRRAGQVDLAVARALQELPRRQVDQLDLVGVLQHRVGHRLRHAGAGDLGDRVLHALEVLHVEGRVHVDAGLDQLDHVLPALGVARSRHVGMGDLVDHQQIGPTRERGVQVELGGRLSRDRHAARRQDLEAHQEARGVTPAVRVHRADQHARPGALARMRRLEHRIGLADARGGPEEDLERPALARRRVA